MDASAQHAYKHTHMCIYFSRYLPICIKTINAIIHYNSLELIYGTYNPFLQQ